MAVSGVVIQFEGDADAGTLATLAGDPRVTVGPARDRRLALVLDTPTAISDVDALQWLWSLPGVARVDLVCVHGDADQPTEVPAAASYL